MNLLWQAIGAIASAVTRPPALLLGSLLGFGILIPYRLGLTFGDSRMLLAYAFLPMLFVSAPVAMGIGRARETTQKLYTWLAAGILLGLALWAALVILALLTMTIVVYPQRPTYPGLEAVLTHALFCAVSCWVSVAISAYLAMVFTPEAARNSMRVLFLLILLWMQFGPAMLSPRLRWYLSGLSPALFSAAGLLFTVGVTNAVRAGVNEKPPIASQ